MKVAEQKTIKKVLLIIVMVLLLLAIVFSLYDAFTIWPLINDNVFIQIFDNIGSTLSFADSNTITFSVLALTSIVVILALPIGWIASFMKRKKRSPFFELGLYLAAGIIFFLFVSNLQNEYASRFEAGSVITLFILLFSVIPLVLFIPISYLSVAISVKEGKNELAESVVIEPKTAQSSGNSIQNNTTVVINNQGCSNGDYIDVGVQKDINIDDGAAKISECVTVHRRPGVTNIKDLPEDSFVLRLYESNQDIRDMYNLIKNELVSYGFKSSVSRYGDTFRIKREVSAKITISGRSLKLFLALNPKNYISTTFPVYYESSAAGYKEIPLVCKVDDLIYKDAILRAIYDLSKSKSLAKLQVPYVDFSEELFNGYTK